MNCVQPAGRIPHALRTAILDASNQNVSISSDHQIRGDRNAPQRNTAPPPHPAQPRSV